MLYNNISKSQFWFEPIENALFIWNLWESKTEIKLGESEKGLEVGEAIGNKFIG